MIEARAMAERMHARPVAYDPKNRKVKLTAPDWACPCWIPLDITTPKEPEGKEMFTHDTIKELIDAWDKGEIITSIELGGLGPGYEQALQIAAVEFARAIKDQPFDKDSNEDGAKARKICDKITFNHPEVKGITGAQYRQALWLAWQWCFVQGPARLIRRAKDDGWEARIIMVSKRFQGQEVQNAD